MEQINTSFIQNYFKNKNKLTIYKNIFYIKLLGYFEDMSFVQYLNFNGQISKFEWYFLVLLVLFISKCSDQFVDKFINEYYNIFPLKQRLENIRRFNFSALNANISKVIKSIDKLSFYEQKEFVKRYLNKNGSPTQLIICRLVSSEEMIKYMCEKECFNCAINLYNSKYISNDMFLPNTNFVIFYHKIMFV